MNTRFATLCAAAAALLTVKLVSPSPRTSPAGIVGVSGSAKLYSDPASVARDIWESNRRTRVFEEQTGLTLESDLHVDITISGRVDDDSMMSPGTIAAGSTVNSYFIHQDPLGPRGKLLLAGKVRFDQQIVGVIINDQTMLDTDVMLGNSNTVYPDGLMARGLDFKQPLEFVKISKDGMKLKYQLYTTTVMDQIRVLTQLTPVPAPGAAAIMLGGLLGFNRRRRTA
jgi:hypothetical protein